tara:strand:- start:394 stop:705 length:312 start_codon:yes stop_codon:yes gene_type:complete
MASGDVFSETNGTIGASATVSIRPAVGVQVVITNGFAETTNVFVAFTTGENLYFGNSSTTSSLHWQQFGSGNFKMMLTNDEYINLYNNDGGQSLQYGYTGMEI